MTRIQYDHHAEQMEAFRAEFYEMWENAVMFSPCLKKMNAKDLAVIELREWNRWYSERKSK